MGPQGWNLVLETGIFASRLEFGPRDLNLRGRDGGENKGENPPYVLKHRSLTPSGPLPCSLFNFKHNLLSRARVPLCCHLSKMIFTNLVFNRNFTQLLLSENLTEGYEVSLFENYSCFCAEYSIYYEPNSYWIPRCQKRVEASFFMMI